MTLRTIDGMTAAKRLAVVLVFYLVADFVDASAPGVFFFDSALFLGTVVQSKARSVDVVDHAHDACRALDNGLPTIAHERRSMQRRCRTSLSVTTKTPLARDATFTPTPPAATEDH